MRITSANVVVEKFAKGKPVSERLRIASAWDQIAKKYEGKETLDGALPIFGQIAIEFIKKMRAGQPKD